MKNNINQTIISRWDNFGKEVKMKLDSVQHIIPIDPDELHEIITKLEKMSNDCDSHESDVKKIIGNSITELKYVLQRMKKSF